MFQYLHVPAKDLSEAINKYPKLERHMWGILAARKLAPLYAQMKQFRVSFFYIIQILMMNLVLTTVSISSPKKINKKKLIVFQLKRLNF